MVEETGGDLEFCDESKMTRGGLVFIVLKISEVVLNSTIADSFRTYQQRFAVLV
jgi:hypothetical protein